jgi:hypothetical protein
MKRTRPLLGLRLVAVVAIACLPPVTAGAESRDSAGLQTSSTSTDEQSRVLHDGTHWTLIPAQSVLHLPEKLRSRLDRPTTGKPLLWDEFLRRNAGWLGTEKVTLREAEGRESIDARRLRDLSRRSKLVIAVFQGKPIGVGQSR